jgi:hypothetical protein
VAHVARTLRPPKARRGSRPAPRRKRHEAHETTPGRAAKPRLSTCSSATESWKHSACLVLLSYRQGTAQGDLLAAHSLRGFLSGTVGKKDGPDRYVHQGRGRRAQLLHQSLISTQNFPSAAGFSPGGFSRLCCAQRPKFQGIRTATVRIRRTARNLAARDAFPRARLLVELDISLGDGVLDDAG